MKSKHQLIGLKGLAGSGKDTVRSILEDIGYVGMAFADPIRAMLRELLTNNGISDQYIDSREFKEAIIPELGVSYRQMAQTLGTEWGRSLHPEFWLKLTGTYMDDIAGDFDGARKAHFVISDVRFPNEAAWVRARGGLVWHVNRPDAAPVRQHASETEMLDIPHDLVINNTGSVADLQQAVLLAIVGVS